MNRTWNFTKDINIRDKETIVKLGKQSKMHEGNKCMSLSL